MLSVLLVFGALVAALNWEAMRTPLRLELLVGSLDVAVGWVVLSAALVPALVLLLAGLLDQARSLRRLDVLERRLDDARTAAERARSAELEALQAELEAKLEAVRAALEGQAQGSETRLDARFDALEASLGERFEELRERVVRVRDELAADIAETEDTLLRGRVGPVRDPEEPDDA